MAQPFWKLLILLISIIFSTHAWAKIKDTRPNIVFIIADDVSAEDLACYGHPTIKTPHIDALAKGGMKFTNAYLTTSSCSPSRCSIITGRYPHNTGAPELHMPLPKTQVLFPKLLKDSGYYTALAGKNHMGKHASTAFDRGEEKARPSGAEQWIEVLQQRPKDKPFFFWFASRDAHREWQLNNKAKKYDLKDIVVPVFMVDDEQTRKDFTGYYHEISRLDYYVGQVVKELKRQGVYENTMIIVTADNGRPFLRCKTRLYDSGIKTPFIVHWPNQIKKGQVNPNLLSVIDISATCLEIASVKKPDEIQGISFLPMLKDPKKTIREVIFAEQNWHVFKNHSRMVKVGQWVYIKNNYPNQRNLSLEALNTPSSWAYWDAYHAGKLNASQQQVAMKKCPKEELFFVGDDPDQLSNLAGKKKHQETLLKMRSLLKQWTKSTGDSVPRSPSFDRMVRRVYRSGHKKAKSLHAELPGQSKGASSLNGKGPVKIHR